MEANLIFWWVVASVAVGLGAYWFFSWLFSGKEDDQTEEEKQEELKEQLRTITSVSDPRKQEALIQ